MLVGATNCSGDALRQLRQAAQADEMTACATRNVAAVQPRGRSRPPNRLTIQTARSAHNELIVQTARSASKQLAEKFDAASAERTKALLPNNGTKNCRSVRSSRTQPLPKHTALN